MEPSFKRGDILFLNMGDAPFRVGEIVVFKIEGREIPIVHRVIKIHEKYSILPIAPSRLVFGRLRARLLHSLASDAHGALMSYLCFHIPMNVSPSLRELCRFSPPV